MSVKILTGMSLKILPGMSLKILPGMSVRTLPGVTGRHIISMNVAESDPEKRSGWNETLFPVRQCQETGAE